MIDNLVDLFTELSHEVIKQEYNIDNEEFENKKKDGTFKKYISKLRQKGFDILLRSNAEMDCSDPCKTPYGANWNPVILLLDYGGELAKYGGEKENKVLITSIQVLQSKSYRCLGDMYKILFILRGSCESLIQEPQLNFLNAVTEYCFKLDCSKESDVNESDMQSSVKSLYADQSSGVLESGCQLLARLSKRSIPSERISNRHPLSLGSSKIINRTRSSVSSNFALKKKSQSSNSFVEVASILCNSNHSLWDNFVEKPITIKSRIGDPLVENNSYIVDGSGGGEQVGRDFRFSLPQKLNNISKFDNYWTHICDNEESSTLENDENLYFKAPEHLYPILKEKCLKLSNYKSCFSRKFKTEKRTSSQNIKNSFFESSATLILALWEQEHKFQCIYDAELGFGVTQLRIMELDQFLKDVQFLLVGVGTDTFKLNEEQMTFTMTEGTCLEGVTPNTLSNFSREYLEIGASYVKLSCYARYHLKKQMTSNLKECKIIFKVFWMSVYEYLCRHSQYVLKIPTSLGLLEFKACVKNLYPIITSVAELCKVSNPDSVLPQGGQLLTYLFQTARKVTNKYACGVFFGILKSCCETYMLQLLQEWMFQGHVDRNHREFFVEHRPKKPKCKDRSYYLSFFVFSERIPSFLKGLENSIFNCGKTIHLLKLIQPDSKLCRLLETRLYPKIKLRLSERDLTEQLRMFEDYARNITKVCGRFVSIASLRQEERDREAHYEKYIMTVKKEQEIKREMLRKESMEELRRKREEQNQWLKEQVEHAAEEKKRKKEQEDMESKLFVQKVRQLAEEEKRIVEEEKQNMKYYYQELMEEIEKRKNETSSWKAHSDRMNKKNSALRNYRSHEEVPLTRNITESESIGDGLSTGSLCTALLPVDSEGNLVELSSDTTCGTPTLDYINSNFSQQTIDSWVEDLKNENVTDDDVPEAHLQKLVESRIGYQEQMNLDENSTSEESDFRNDFTSESSESTTELSMSDKNVGTGQSMEEVTVSEDRLLKTNSETSDSAKITSMEVTSFYDTDVTESISSLQSEAQKNKLKMMTSEYGILPDPVKSEVNNFGDGAHVIMTEAQKNKERVMSSEYEISKKTDKSATKAVAKPVLAVETQAQKNKKKVMQSEYGLIHDSKPKAPPRKVPEVETEAQKNKKKVMSSEFGLQPESGETTATAPKGENEAQRNKKKAMACEFGDVSQVPEDLASGCRRVLSSEAQANRQKILEIEYGYVTVHDKTTNTDEDSINKVESETSINDGSLNVGISEEELLDLGSNGVKGPSFAEKALRIFNKRRDLSDDPKFFTLQDKSSEDSLQDGARWYSEVQILFEQHLRRPMVHSDPTVIGPGFTDMDITTFMNCVRKSVLIPLKIQEAVANEALFNHLLKNENMLGHFNSLRNYYFLNDGEFARRLTQNIFATLATCTEPQQFFKRSTLNQIVYEALNYTIHSNEPNIDNVSFEIVDMPEFLSHSSHNVLAPFHLSYQVKWPLNIIVTEKALSKYKMVFHFLLKLKRINWTLNENFSHLNYSTRDKRLNHRVLINSPHYHKIHIYRHAMGQFMRTLENYTSSCSLQHTWFNFQKDLESAKNLDDLYEKHVRYIKDVLKRCFLTKESHELLDCIHLLIEHSLKFHYSTKCGRWVLNNGKYEHTKFEVLKCTFSEFCSVTKDFLKTLRKKINSHHDLKPHEILMEKFDMILN